MLQSDYPGRIGNISERNRSICAETSAPGSIGGRAIPNGTAVEESQAVDHDGRRDASNLTIALILGYVRAQAGEQGVAQLLALAGERRTVPELQDETGWSTQAQKVALFEAV